MFCTKCGHQIADDDKFCSKCGAVAVQPMAAPAVAPESPAAADIPAEPIPSVAEEIPAEPILPAAEEIPAELEPSAVEQSPAAEAAPEPVIAEPPVAPVAPPPAAPAEPAYAAPVATMPPKTKKSHKGLIIGIVAAVAALLISAGTWFLVDYLIGDRDPSDPTVSGQDDPTGESQPDSQPDSQPSSTPDVDHPPVEPPVDPPLTDITLSVLPAELTYEMTDADVDRFYDLLTQCKEAALGGQDGDAVMAIHDAIDELNEYMNAQYSIAMVLFYCDVNDDSASQLYLDCTDILTEAYDAYMEMAKELYDADFPAKDRFFADWTERDLAELLAYTPEVMELEQRNSEIEVAYQDLQDDDDMYTKMVPLYIEMVQNNNRIAQIYGYNNYYEYAYELVYDRDYSIEQVHTMRSYVSQYLPDAASGAMSRLMESMNELSYSQYMKFSEFLWESYEGSYTDEIEAYLETLPRSAQEAMLDMFNGNIVMMDTAESAREGAFTTTIGEDRQICFFGPGYCNALTILHEVGHYYGGTYTYLHDIPLDLAEVQSQGNEWLFMSFLEGEMLNKLYGATLDYKLYSDMVTIMISTIIDEFEEQVYTHPNIANLTSDDLDAIMASVCERYGGIDFLGEIATDIQSYWRLVVVEQPVYYISYGVSAIAAIDIYTVAAEDYDKGVQVYCDLIEGIAIEDGFLGNLTKVGLSGPFDEDIYKKLYDMAS